MEGQAHEGEQELDHGARAGLDRGAEVDLDKEAMVGLGHGAVADRGAVEQVTTRSEPVEQEARWS